MVLSIQDHCERILLGPSLADKLAVCPEACVDAPREGAAIDAPARAAGLESRGGRGLQGPAPGLHGDDTRIELLHAFANHELLAIELMARAVLQFEGAPPSFRRGLMQTMAEEQRHLALYLERMAELGGSMQDAPLSGFFWRAFQAVRTPLEFVTAMGLTFEQANLDYAHHYRGVFEAEGDGATARVLQEVFDDEIRHVKFAWVWFSRWRLPNESPLRSHERNLVMPMTVDRARGLSPSLAHRRSAGLPDSYARGILGAPAAKGRAPSIYLFNPNCEDEIEYGVHRRPPAVRERAAQDWACAPTILAAASDVVVAREPSGAYVDRLRVAGLPVPRFIAAEDLAAATMPTVLAVRPWGASPRAEAIVGPLRELLGAGLPRDAAFGPAQAELFRKDRVAAWAGTILTQLEPEAPVDGPDLQGQVADLMQSVELVASHWRAMGFADVLIKQPFGAAGRGLIRLVGGAMTKAQRGRVRRVLARNGAVLVEPWLDRVCDLSFVARVSSGRGELLDVVQSRIDARGQYAGSVVERPMRLGSALTTELRRFIHGDGADPQWLTRVARSVVEAIAPRLIAAGLCGPFGVDAFVHRLPDGRLQLRAMVELNPRMTMGHLAHRCAALLAPDRTGELRVLPAEIMLGAPEPVLGPRGLIDGVVWLTDPVDARTGLALAVGPAAR